MLRVIKSSPVYNQERVGEFVEGGYKISNWKVTPL